MKMKRKVKRSITATKIAATFYCYFCCRHILITFVGMTLLIVNYGVDTVLMSDVPHSNGNTNSNNYSNGKSYSNNNTNNKYTVITNTNAYNKYNNNNNNNNDNRNSDYIYKFIIPMANDENIKATDMKQKYNNNYNTNKNANLLQISLLKFLTANKGNNNSKNDTRTYAYDVAVDLYVDSNNISNSINDTLPLPSAEVFGQLGNFRKARIFGLLGTNFSLSYNLSLATGNSVGNITIAAPAAAPAYYYSAAPYYPYGYGYDPYGYGYNPYGYYDPYAYNPYAYNPYAGYGYYG